MGNSLKYVPIHTAKLPRCKKGRNRPDDISAYYEIKNKIGSGNFATVKRAIRHVDGREFAIKCIKKSRLTREELYIIDSEVAVMRTLRHRHVVRLFEIFETRKRIYIVMELLSGGELFDRIVQKGSFSEREASEVVRDLASAIAYLHSIGVVHRDLKPENILYSSPHPDAVIKVTDFGLAKRSERDKGYMTTACGTPGYVAPEVLKGEPYDKAVDMWSLGVILYILLCGFPPFYSDNTAELYHRIKTGDYHFPSPYWDEVSPAAIELIRGLLNIDPKTRLSAEEVLQHPWVCGGIARSQNFSQHHTNRIRLLQAKRKLRRNVQIIIACNRFASILQIAATLDKDSAPTPLPSPSPSHLDSPTKSDATAHLPEDLTLMAYRRHNIIADGQDVGDFEELARTSGSHASGDFLGPTRSLSYNLSSGAGGSVGQVTERVRRLSIGSNEAMAVAIDGSAPRASVRKFTSKEKEEREKMAAAAAAAGAVAAVSADDANAVAVAGAPSAGTGVVMAFGSPVHTNTIARGDGAAAEYPQLATTLSPLAALIPVPAPNTTTTTGMITGTAAGTGMDGLVIAGTAGVNASANSSMNDDIHSQNERQSISNALAFTNAIYSSSQMDLGYQGPPSPSPPPAQSDANPEKQGLENSENVSGYNGVAPSIPNKSVAAGITSGNSFTSVSIISSASSAASTSTSASTSAAPAYPAPIPAMAATVNSPTGMGAGMGVGVNSGYFNSGGLMSPSTFSPSAFEMALGNPDAQYGTPTATTTTTSTTNPITSSSTYATTATAGGVAGQAMASSALAVGFAAMQLDPKAAVVYPDGGMGAAIGAESPHGDRVMPLPTAAFMSPVKQMEGFDGQGMEDGVMAVPLNDSIMSVASVASTQQQQDFQIVVTPNTPEMFARKVPPRK